MTTMSKGSLGLGTSRISNSKRTQSSSSSSAPPSNTNLYSFGYELDEVFRK